MRLPYKVKNTLFFVVVYIFLEAMMTTGISHQEYLRKKAKFAETIENTAICINYSSNNPRKIRRS